MSKAGTLRGKLHSLLTNKLILSSYQMSESSLNIYYKKLKKYRPAVLISYPSPLITFCRYLKNNEYTIPGLKAIVTSAETLYQWQKELIEDTLKCNVYNRYGCREFGDIAHEFPCRNGLHIHSHRFYIEILDDKYEPVSTEKQARYSLRI